MDRRGYDRAWRRRDRRRVAPAILGATATSLPEVSEVGKSDGESVFVPGTRPADTLDRWKVRPLEGKRFYVNPVSPARRQVVAWSVSRPDDAALMDRIACRPTGFWFGDWNQDLSGDVDRVVSDAARRGALPLLVAYNLPNRDCNRYSAAGAASAAAYRRWLTELAEGIGAREAIVVLEPDALGLVSCLTPAERAERFALLREAVSILKARTDAIVYIDAGHARWVEESEMAQRLHLAGLARADGFALNTAFFEPTESTLQYGERLSRRLAGARFVIDTSRNGEPVPDRDQCNPEGAALGHAPTIATGHPLCEAFLWIKPPGESDGACNDGPPAGQWWPDYALRLARNAG